MSKLEEAFKAWRLGRAAGWTADQPLPTIATLLTDRELALCQQAFEGGVRAALVIAATDAKSYRDDAEHSWADAAEMVRDDIRVMLLGLPPIDPRHSGLG